MDSFEDHDDVQNVWATSISTNESSRRAESFGEITSSQPLAVRRGARRGEVREFTSGTRGGRVPSLTKKSELVSFHKL